MDTNTRRVVTWIILGAVVLALIIYGVHQRRLIPSALRQMAEAPLDQQVAAARTLVERNKVAEALENQPRWLQVGAVRALLALGTPEALRQLTEAAPHLDEPVAEWAAQSVAAFGRMAIGPLVECLQHKDAAVRTAAKEPLIVIGGPPVISAVELLMGAFDEPVRLVVTEVLAALGEPAAMAAIDCLHREQPLPDQTNAAFVRSQATALNVLATMGEPALEPVIAHLAPDRRSIVRANAALVLGRLVANLEEEPQRVIPPLLTLIRDPAEAVRARAAAALGELGEKGRREDVQGALIAALADPEARGSAVKSLGQIGAPQAAPALVNTLLQARAGVSRELVTALIALGPSTLPALQPALTSPDPEARELATEAVAGIPGTDAVPLLGDRLADSHVQVRRIAAGALRDRATAQVAGPLAQALGDEDFLVYTAAQAALRRVGAAAIPALVAQLGPNPRLSLNAHQVLVALGRPAVPALAQALRSEQSDIRAWAAATLGDIGGDSVEVLRRIVLDATEPPPTRMAAADAFGRTGLPAAVEPLAALARAPSPALRQTALRALARTRRAQATSTLVAALQDPQPEVRWVALQVLKDWQIGDVDEQLAQVVQTASGQTQRFAAIALAIHDAPRVYPTLGRVFEVRALTDEVQAQIARLLNETAADSAALAPVRQEALVALAHAGDDASLEVMGGFLRADEPLAGLAARSLGVLVAHLAAERSVSEEILDAAISRLVDILLTTPDDQLRVQAAAALSLMERAPVPLLLQALTTAPETLKPWIAAVLGTIGKPANEPAMIERGREGGEVEWATVAVRLIGHPESIKFLARLPERDQPDPDKVQQGEAVYNRIMQMRTIPVA